MISPRLMSQNSLIGSGTSLPVASTGMSSYLSKFIPVFPVPNRSLKNFDYKNSKYSNEHTDFKFQVIPSFRQKFFDHLNMLTSLTASRWNLFIMCKSTSPKLRSLAWVWTSQLCDDPESYYHDDGHGRPDDRSHCVLHSCRCGRSGLCGRTHDRPLIFWLSDHV